MVDLLVINPSILCFYKLLLLRFPYPTNKMLGKTLHKKWSFILRIFSVNVTKSAVKFHRKIFAGKLQFLCNKTLHILLQFLCKRVKHCLNIWWLMERLKTDILELWDWKSGSFTSHTIFLHPYFISYLIAADEMLEKYIFWSVLV